MGFWSNYITPYLAQIMKSWDKYELDDYLKIFFKDELLKNCDNLKSRFQNSYKELEKRLDIVEKTVRHASFNDWDNIKYLFNVAGFILTASLDLKIYGESLVFLNGYGKKELQIRNLCVLIYETSEDLEQILGKEFYEKCLECGISRDIIDELNNTKKKLSEFKNEHQKSLKTIRTIIGAHRDHDFVLQMDVIKNLSYSSFLSVVTKFDDIINNISIPLQKY